MFATPDSPDSNVSIKSSPKLHSNIKETTYKVEKASRLLDSIDEHITKNQVKSQLRELGYDKDIPEHILDEFMQEMKSAYPSRANELAKKDLSLIKQTVQRQKQEIEPQTEYSLDEFETFDQESVFKPTRKVSYRPPEKPRKKHDPVSRFHQMKAVWSQDKFLKRIGDLSTFKQSRDMSVNKFNFSTGSTTSLNKK